MFLQKNNKEGNSGIGDAGNSRVEQKKSFRLQGVQGATRSAGKGLKIKALILKFSCFNRSY